MEAGYWYVTFYGQTKAALHPGFAMEPQFYRANSCVRESFGRMALVCGPLVYCLEEQDNGKGLHTLVAEPEAASRARQTSLSFINEDAVGYEVPGWRKEPEDTCLYRKASQKEEWEPVTLRFIPYYAWANREEGEMRVWIGQRERN